MEYYAKSKKKELSAEDKEKVKVKLECFLLNQSNLLNEKEKEIVKSSIEKLNREVEEEAQKKLKEHVEDIIKCAEMFFLQYGTYFTEKEKALVIEACRMHDWGKLIYCFNLLFNQKSNRTLKIAGMCHKFRTWLSKRNNNF